MTVLFQYCVPLLDELDHCRVMLLLSCFNIPSLCSLVQLLEKKKRIQLKDMGEDLECLCQIMRTVGPRLDHEKARVSAPR